MTIQVYKDENGNIVRRVISDRKKCLTRKEFVRIVSETPLKNHAYMTGRTYMNDNRYHFVSFNYWAGFTLILAEINSLYGRGIETILDTSENPSCTLLIRAYK